MNAAEALRNADTIFRPDPRSTPQWETLNGHAHLAEIEQRSVQLQQFVLHAGVPEAIRIHFETAKNVYLYAWFVYRFNMVAGQYLYSTLELALRICFYPPEGEVTEGKRPTLAPLLKRALKKGYFSTEKFSMARRHALGQARQRYRSEIGKKVFEENLSGADLDYSQVVPTKDDYDSFNLPQWLDTIPFLRNEHSHGTTSLWPMSQIDFEIAGEMINQLFDDLKEGRSI